MPCPVIGLQEFKNITLNENILTFLPKGVLKIRVKNYNNEDGELFGLSVLFANT